MGEKEPGFFLTARHSQALGQARGRRASRSVKLEISCGHIPGEITSGCAQIFVLSYSGFSHFAPATTPEAGDVK